MKELWASIPSPFKEILLLLLGNFAAQGQRLLGQWLSFRNPTITRIEGRLAAMETLVHFAVAQGGAVTDAVTLQGTAILALIQEIQRQLKSGAPQLERIEEMVKVAKSQLDLFFREQARPTEAESKEKKR